MTGDDVWRRDEIESPCQRICVLHPSARLCIGCYRTGEEIATWSRLTPERRREIMDELPSRERVLTDPAHRPSRRRGRSDGRTRG